MEAPVIEPPISPEARVDLEEINKPVEGEPGGPVALLNDKIEGRALLSIVQEFNRHEQFVRETQMKKWRKHHHYWNSLQYLAWSEVAHDWMTADDILEKDPQSDLDPAAYAKVINVFKAHGEILIGALTSGLPAVRFFPKDADDHEDVVSAKARSRIAELIQRQNKARLILMRALFLMYNEGVIFAYNENKQDARFGVIEEPEYDEVEMQSRDSYCPACGMGFGSETFDPAQGEDPQMSEQTCPQCGQVVQPEFDDTPEMQNIPSGVKKTPKNRECIEIYGPMNVAIPMWCREQTAVPMLNLKTEESIYMLKEIYQEYADIISSTSYPDTYEKEMRVPSNYKNDFPREIATCERVWIRNWAFNYFRRDSEEFKALKAMFKDEDAYVVIINGDQVVEMLPDKLDERWTISFNPLAETLHAEPLGTPMVPLQDITNELGNLTLETIEFGIPEMFASGQVLDFDAYQKVEARPGQITQANIPAGQTLSAGFHEVKPASLSREVELFADRITNVSQFVMGSYPSVYGGAQDGGSGTAREYELSKASALQRLSSTWLIIQEFWAQVMGKAVQSFVTNMKEDQKFVTAKGSNFVNVWIKKAELTGSVGEVEPEISETFPISWAQKRDVILNLMQMKDEDISAVIRHPENAGLVASIIGVPELFIPGDDSRNKQLAEIAILLLAEPMEVPPNALNPSGLLSSIPVSPELDEHPVEAEICKAWMRSEVGQDAKETNPPGYANVMAHLKEHLFFEAQMMAQPAPTDGSGDTSGQQGQGDMSGEGLSNAGA